MEKRVAERCVVHEPVFERKVTGKTVFGFGFMFSGRWNGDRTDFLRKGLFYLVFLFFGVFLVVFGALCRGSRPTTGLATHGTLDVL